LAAPRVAPDDYHPLNPAPHSTTANSGGAGAAVAAARLPDERPNFEAIQGGMPSAMSGPGRPPVGGYQPTLFREGGPNKVVAIPTLAPLRPHVQEAPVRRTPRMPARQPGSRLDRSVRGVAPQQAFQFIGEPAQAASGDVIFCDAPVALPAHRMMAAAMDTSLVLIGAGVLLGVFLLGQSLFAGGELVLNRQTVPFLLGVVAVLALFYRMLWCIADGDTPGMRFAGLKLVDFDGRRPNREMRSLRQAASLLSLLSVGLGLVWALVDEENLTWHDHISKTFPTAD
jgi:uncharacterized RDD family membrane protein YckC